MNITPNPADLQLFKNYKSSNPTSAGTSPDPNDWYSNMKQGAYRPNGGQSQSAPDTSVGFAGTKIAGETLGLLSSGKMLGQTANAGQSLQSKLDTRLQSGQLNKDRYNQLSQGLQPDISNVVPKRTTGDVVRGGVKAATDLASLAVGGEGAGTLAENTVGGAIKQGAIQGAKSGALSGGIQGAGQGLESGKTLKSTLSGGEKGALIGGVTGGAIGAAAPAVSEAATAIKEKASSIVKGGKTVQEIMAIPESEIHKLSDVERKTYFDELKRGIDKQAESTTLKNKVFTQVKQDALQTQAESLSQKMKTASRDETINLRPKIIQAMGEQSSEYRRLVQEDLAPHANVPVKTTDLNSYIDNRFAENPEVAQAIKQKLNTTEKVNPLSDVTDKASKVKSETTLGELYDRTQSLKQTIGSAAKKGNVVFSSSEKLTDDAISTLSDFMKENGVDLKNANQFWSKYAPIRDQLVQESKPFNIVGTRTETFANRLTKIAQGKDINNENFIKEVENLVGPVGKDVRDIASKLDVNQKQQIALEAERNLKKIQADLSKSKAYQALTEKEQEIELKANARKWWKRFWVAFAIGGAGAAGAETVNAFTK